MATHRIFMDSGVSLAPGPLTITGEEAHHAARVKRVQVGDRVDILDGRGGIGEATVAAIDKGDAGRWRLVAQVSAVHAAARPSPRLEVLSAAPKGSRLEDLIDGLSQVGADGWALLGTDRAEVDPRPGKLERLRRVAAEASKQCGRPWLLEIGPSVQLVAALGRAGPGRSVVVADASGEPYSRSGEPEISLLVGPEGGWSPAELAAVRHSSARVCRFGPHTMRIETAAVAAAAVLLNAESRS